MECKGDRNSFIWKGDERWSWKAGRVVLDSVLSERWHLMALLLLCILLVFSFFPDLFTACQSEHSQSTALNFTLEIQT